MSINRPSWKQSIALGAVVSLTASTALACNPQATIRKDVQDITTGSTIAAADTEATALTVHPGDTLNYRITIRNVATGKDDSVINAQIADALPAGLTATNTDTTMKNNQVGPNETVYRIITAKVTATTPGVIKNQACFTGDSIDHQKPQNVCDVAYIKVVPAPTPSPTPSPSPSQTPSPTPSPTFSPTPSPSDSPTPSPAGGGEVLGDSTTPTTLPDTGATLAGTALGLSSIGGATVAYLKSRKHLR